MKKTAPKGTTQRISDREDYQRAGLNPKDIDKFKRSDAPKLFSKRANLKKKEAYETVPGFENRYTERNHKMADRLININLHRLAEKIKNNQLSLDLEQAMKSWFRALTGENDVEDLYQKFISGGEKNRKFVFNTISGSNDNVRNASGALNVAISDRPDLNVYPNGQVTPRSRRIYETTGNLTQQLEGTDTAQKELKIPAIKSTPISSSVPPSGINKFIQSGGVHFSSPPVFFNVTSSMGRVNNNPSGLFSAPKSPQNISPELRRYVDSFNGKSSNSEKCEQLGILPESEGAVDIECPITKVLPEKPVRLDGEIYDFEALVKLPKDSDGNRENPLTRDKFSLLEVQAARDVQDRIEEMFANHESVSRLDSSSQPSQPGRLI